MRAAAAAAALFAAGAAGYDCPPYDSIAKPSVASGSYAPNELAGLWYMMATTEPTMPAFCTCNELNFTVSGGTYEYTSHSLAGACSFLTLKIDGVLNDTSRPGLMYENAVILGKQTLPLDPNMIFDVSRGADGSVDKAWGYACLGKGKFSFNFLSRSSALTQAEIEAAIAPANKTGVFDLSGLRYSDSDQWDGCGVKSGAVRA